MAGLFDNYQPNMALLKAAQSLFEASKSGQGTMQGIASGLLGYQNSKQAQAQALIDKKKAEDEELFNRSYKEDQQKYIRAQTSALGIPKLPTESAAMQGYSKAIEQGYTGSFMEYQVELKKAGGVNITNSLGGGVKVPANFMKDPLNENTVIPIPGGPADESVKLKKEFSNQISMIDSVTEALTTYETVLRETGTQLFPGVKKQRINTAYKDVMLEAKELFKLGVLAGDDLVILEEYLTNPTSIMGSVYEAVGGTEGFNEQIQMVKNKISAARKSAENNFGGGGKDDTELKVIKWGDL